MSRSLDAVHRGTRNQDLSESPTKAQLKFELQQQWLKTQEMIADRDYRTEEALITYRESFKRAASQFEQEDRDTANAEVAESIRRSQLNSAEELQASERMVSMQLNLQELMSKEGTGGELTSSQYQLDGQAKVSKGKCNDKLMK